MSENKNTLLSVKELTKYYAVKNSSLLPSKRKLVHAADGVSFDISEGETLGLVGESGCGKSTVGKQIAGIEKPTSGSILYRGHNIVHMNPKEIGSIRTEIQMIFQDSYASLNPRHRIYEILAAPMIYHHLVSEKEASARVNELLEMVGLPSNSKRRYPHEFSGGQRQRISIARALSLNPKLIVCDEPVSALDVSIQAQILNLLNNLQNQLGISYLFIAHGLGAVHYISDRIAVMYLGRIVEIGGGNEVFHHPLHPYTEMLIAAVPNTDPDHRSNPSLFLKGEVPDAVNLPKGCRFAARCPFADEQCRNREPVLQEYADPQGNSHQAACFHIQGRRSHE